MKSRVYYIALIIILFCIHLQTYAQLDRVEKFEIDEFLGEKNFKTATQSDNLYIYFNTSKGILNYDGHEFKSINHFKNNDGIKQIHYFKDALFVASQNSLSQYFPHNDSVSVIADLSVNQFEEFDNQLWMITDSELYVWENKQLKKIFEAENLEQFKCLVVKDSKIIIGHSKGLTTLKNGKKSKRFASYLTPTKFITADSTVHILSGSTIFELINDKGVSTLQNKTEILDFHIDDFGKTWFIDEQGILKVNDLIKSKPQYLEKNKPITGKGIFNDKEGNLWILGENSLVKSTQKNPFSKISEQNTNKVFVGNNSNIIFKEGEIIMYNFITENIRIKIPKSTTPINKFYALDNEDSWIITINKTIYSLNKNERELIPVLKDSQFVPLKKIEEQYIAKNESGSLFLIDRNFMPVKKIEEASSSSKITFANQKIYLFSNQNRITVLDSAGNTLSKTALNDSINFENIVPAKNGFWYYNSNKLYQINNDGEANLLDFDKSEVLEDIYILNVFDDMENNLWVSSKNILYRFPISVKSNNSTLQKPIEYDKNDFIFSPYYKDAVKDNIGRIWFLNDNGISLYNPLREIPNLIAPSVEIKNAFAYNLDDFNNPIDTIFLKNKSKNISNNSIVVIEPKVINHFDNSKSSIGYRNF